MNTPFVVLDTETASAAGAPHLIEVGAVRVESGEVVDHFQALCCPEVPIEPEATEVHGITDADVMRAAPTAEVLAEFAAWLGDDWLAAHDAPKDARVLGFEFARARIEPPAAPFLCTLRLGRKLIPEALDYRLETLCDTLGLEDGPRHRALADAAWCHQVLEACIDRLAASDRAENPDPRAELQDGEEITLERLLALTGGVPTTIAGHAPAPPGKMKSRWRPLVDACGQGEALRMLYGSETQAPVELSVTPRLLYQSNKKGYLEAECASSGTLKTYRLDRIQKVLQRT